MKNNSILISIVTVVYNGESFIEKTIKSILSQTYKGIEYIIIDGASTDNTLSIIKKYKDKISTILSENDNGLYDAMNKGSRLATGDFINFINAGDTLTSKESIQNIVENIDDKKSLYYSRAKIIGSGGIGWVYPNYEIKDYQHWLSLNLPNHQTLFFPKSFYKNFFYDLRLKIGADDDYKLFALKNCNVEFIDELYVEFKRDGISSNHKSFKLFRQRLKESFIRNLKHKRYIRFFIDPFKLSIMFFINSLFGEELFLKFINIVVSIKGKI